MVSDNAALRPPWADTPRKCPTCGATCCSRAGRGWHCNQCGEQWEPPQAIAVAGFGASGLPEVRAKETGFTAKQRPDGFMFDAPGAKKQKGANLHPSGFARAIARLRHAFGFGKG